MVSIRSRSRRNLQKRKNDTIDFSLKTKLLPPKHRKLSIKMEKLDHGVIESLQKFGLKGPNKKTYENTDEDDERPGPGLKEQHDNSTDDESDHDDEADHDHSMSTYELERLANIKRNEQFFNELNIKEAKNKFGVLVGSASKSSNTYGLKREKKLKTPLAASRVSMRIRRLNPLGVPMPEPSPENSTLSEQFRQIRLQGVVRSDQNPTHDWDRQRKPSGPLEMKSLNDIEDDACKNVIQQWSDLSNQKKLSFRKKKNSFDFDQYCQSVKAFSIADNHVLKVTPSRIFSITIHPMESKQLVIAGGKRGNIGIWDVDSKEGQDGVFLFAPHSAPINVISVCPLDYTKIYSCSYDGTLRCGDLEKQVFTQVYAEPEDEDVSLNAFAWTARSGTTLVVGKNDYTVGVIDIRTGKMENNFVAHGRLVRWVDCHPLNERLIATSCQDGSVATWDLRNAKNIKSKLSETRCTRATSSVFFSPKTGSKILTTSLDNTIRVYDVNANGIIGSTPKCMINHNNQTGRWLTRFRATWDPKTDDNFVVGSMMRPRAVDFYTADGNGSKITQLTHENLSSITSLNVFHPTLNLFAGGNSSGKVFLWK